MIITSFVHPRKAVWRWQKIILADAGGAWNGSSHLSIWKPLHNTMQSTHCHGNVVPFRKRWCSNKSLEERTHARCRSTLCARLQSLSSSGPGCSLEEATLQVMSRYWLGPAKVSSLPLFISSHSHAPLLSNYDSAHGRRKPCKKQEVVLPTKLR